MTLKTTDPEIVSFHIEMAKYICWNKNNTLLVSQIQNAAY